MRSLSPCWYWMPIVSQPNSAAMRTAAMYIRHWSNTCASVRVGRFVGSEVEFHARLDQPVIDGARLLVLHRLHLCVQRGLAQPLLEDAGGMQQRIGDDGVEHAHATLVEDAHDELLALELFREFAARLSRRGGHLHGPSGRTCGRRMLHLAGLEPRAQALEEEGVGEILAPKRAVGHARLGQRAVEVEHADEAGPGAAPVRHGEDRSAMR